MCVPVVFVISPAAHIPDLAAAASRTVSIPVATSTGDGGSGSGSSFKRADVLDAMQALHVSDDLQDAVARALASTRLVSGDRLRAALREAGVPDRVALRVEVRLVSGEGGGAFYLFCIPCLIFLHPFVCVAVGNLGFLLSAIRRPSTSESVWWCVVWCVYGGRGGLYV